MVSKQKRSTLQFLFSCSKNLFLKLGMTLFQVGLPVFELGSDLSNLGLSLFKLGLYFSNLDYLSLSLSKLWTLSHE